LDLADKKGLLNAITNSNLVIHCAGPFHYRDTRVLKTCIEQGANYLDVITLIYPQSPGVP